MLAYLTGAAALALGIGLVLFIRKKAPKTVTVCALIVGAALAGWAGAAISQVGGAIGRASDTLGGQLIGVGLSGGLAAGALTWLYLDWKAASKGGGGGAGKSAGGGKGGKSAKVMPALALLTPSLLVPMLFGSLDAVPALAPATNALHSLYSSVIGA